MASLCQESDGAETTGNEDVFDDGDHSPVWQELTLLNHLHWTKTQMRTWQHFQDQWFRTIHVKNTNNGDVDITFSEINSPYNTGTYVAVWGDDNGGIAWSRPSLCLWCRFIFLWWWSRKRWKWCRYLWTYLELRLFKATAQTSNDVSVVTFNDINKHPGYYNEWFGRCKSWNW